MDNKMKFEHCFAAFMKINSRRAIFLNVIVKTIKLLEKSRREDLCKFGPGKPFQREHYKALAIKKLMN